MPIPTSDTKLDTILRAALTSGPQRLTIWAMLHDPVGADRVSRNAQPIKVVVEIVAEDGALVWHPLSGVTMDGAEVDVEALRGERVWWCSWTRKFAAARLRVELERQAELDRAAGDQALAGLDAWELALAGATARALGVLTPREREELQRRYGLDGDKEFRVLAEFPAPRGYGEA